MGWTVPEGGEAKHFENVFDQGRPASRCRECGKVVYSAQEMTEHVCDKSFYPKVSEKEAN